jgi:hypothetical protein
MARLEDLDQTLGDFMPSFVSLRVELAALLSLCEGVAAQVGGEPWDAAPVIDGYVRQRLQELRGALAELEDAEPTLAALLHERLGEARDAIRTDRPEPV